MKVFFKELVFSTRSRFEVVDITERVEALVAESGVSNGICVVHAPHATAAIVLNEHEAGLLADIIRLIRELFKPGGDWRHNMIDDNAHAHLASAVIGSTRVVPVKDGRLLRGTWQNILFIEMDGPRSYRRVVVEVMGE